MMAIITFRLKQKKLNFPGRETDLDRERYILIVNQENGQIVNIYTPDNNIIEIIRAAMSV